MKREDQIIRRACIAWINDYCGQNFIDGDLPGGVELALIRLVEFNKGPVGIASQTIGDMSISYTQGVTENPAIADIKRFLAPYVRMRVK